MYTDESIPSVLSNYAHRQGALFHMPGHKGRGMRGFWRSELVRWDVTELEHTDDLHSPHGILRRAQEEYARACGAGHTFFLVNGATAGVLAMFLALPRGSKVLFSRDAHRSAVSGAALAGMDVEYILPAYDEETELWGMVTAQALDEALERTKATAVLLTTPNYFGMCADMPALYAAAKKHGALVLCDAAHGAHFPYSESLPQSPAGYADLWVHSVHKTLNALGQAAVLHLAEGCGIAPESVQHALSIVQSSSPSYLLMSSIDWARYSAQRLQNWEKHVAHCLRVREQIDNLPGLKTLSKSVVGRAGISDVDMTRIVIDVTERGINGFTARDSLAEQNVFVEMADIRRVTLITSPSDDPEWYDMLLNALRRMPYGQEKAKTMNHKLTLPPERMTVREATLAKTRRIPLEDAGNAVLAQAVGMYPPGIALCMPGEVLLPETIEVMVKMEKLGASLFGLHDGKVSAVEEEGNGE